MREAMQQIINTLNQYYGSNYFGLIYLVALVYLFFFKKDSRKTVVLPSMLVMVVIINPFLYEKLYTKILTYAYWRLVWFIPILPVIGIAFVDLLGKLPKRWMRPITAVVLGCVLIYSGTNVYSEELGKFTTEKSNNYKLPAEAIHVADALLELDDSPTAVVPPELYCYIRQYSADIHLLYGRDAEGYIYPEGFRDSRSERLNTLINKEEFQDWEAVRDELISEKIQYFVYYYDNSSMEDMLSVGFVIKDSLDGYNIFELNEDY